MPEKKEKKMCIQVGSTILLTKFLTCVAYGCKDNFRFRRFKDKECCFAGRNGITEPLHQRIPWYQHYFYMPVVNCIVLRVWYLGWDQVPSSAADPEFVFKEGGRWGDKGGLRWTFNYI